jgi:hypothetical protein
LETVPYDGMNRIFWNCASKQSSISSVSFASWKPNCRAFVVSERVPMGTLRE